MGESARRREEQRFLLLSGGKGKKGIPLEDWMCKCGFKNIYRNTVCGGNGNMGCKTERAIGAVQGAGMPAGSSQPGFNASQQSASSKLKGVPCRYYNNGRCSKGDMCPFFHDPNLDTNAILAAKGGKGVEVPGCLFLPRISDGLQAYHLQAYFSQFGKLISIFGPIPKAIGSIAYVRFEDAASAERVLAQGEDHYVKGDLYVRCEQNIEIEGKGKGKKGKDRMFSAPMDDSHGGERVYSFGSGGLEVSYRPNANNMI